MKLTAVVYNPRSGSAPSLRELKKHFNEAAIEVERYIDITKELSKLKHLSSQKGSIIAAVGGDGTLSSVAGMLINSDAIFAPLPGGTLNHFTKDLGMPQELPQAISRLSTLRPRQIDAAQVNGTVFINNSSIGLYPSSLQTREELEAKKLGKWSAAFIAAVKALVHYRSLTVTIHSETFKTPFIFVGNNDYHLENNVMGERHSLSSKKLSVYAVASASRWSLVKIIAGTLLGRLAITDDIKIWKTTKLTVHAKKKQLRISRDGELEKTPTPLHYEIAAGSLTIIGSS